MSNSSGPTMRYHRKAPAAFDLHPCAEEDAPGIAPAGIRTGIDDGHAFEPLAQKAHSAIDLVQALLAVGVFGIF